MNYVLLKVSEASMEDVSKGICRIDFSSCKNLNLTVGDVISIEGKKVTPAIVWRAHPSDEGKGFIKIDGLIRDNAGVSIGDDVKIKKSDVSPATKVILYSKEDKVVNKFGVGIEGVVKRGLFKRPVIKGDVLIVPGIAFAGRAVPFEVLDTEPKGIVQITENTEVIVNKDESKSERDIAIEYLNQAENLIHADNDAAIALATIGNTWALLALEKKFSR